MCVRRGHGTCVCSRRASRLVELGVDGGAAGFQGVASVTCGACLLIRWRQGRPRLEACGCSGGAPPGSWMRLKTGSCGEFGAHETRTSRVAMCVRGPSSLECGGVGAVLPRPINGCITEDRRTITGTRDMATNAPAAERPVYWLVLFHSAHPST